MVIHRIDHTVIRLPYEEIAAFCRRHHIIRLWIYGSVLREDFSPESDVDVLVEFDEGHIPGWNIVSIEDELSSLLMRYVELGVPDGLNSSVKSQIMTTAQLIFEDDERTG